MTKQKEIRRAIEDIIKSNCLGAHEGELRGASGNIMTYLDSQGAVLKVERELPENPYANHVHLDAGIYDGLYREKYFEAQQDMLKGNFSAFEPLI